MIDSLEARIRDRIKQKYFPFHDEGSRPFIEYFKEMFGIGLSSIIFYGSCLDKVTEDPTSIRDYFVIVKDYKKAFNSHFHSILAGFLPPSSYFLELRADSSPSLICKYNVLSQGHLTRETSHKARDVYIFGRLAKRIGLVYVKDGFALRLTIDCLYEAMKRNVELALSRIQGEFGPDEFVRVLLRQSYSGEKRVESDDKVERIYLAEKDYYRDVYGMFLEFYIKKEDWGLRTLPNGGFSINLPRAEMNGRRKRAEKFLRKSRIRARLRWPKGILTFDNWVNYLLAKVERAHGIRIELTPWERRLPLVLGWRHYFRLKGEGKIK